MKNIIPALILIVIIAASFSNYGCTDRSEKYNQKAFAVADSIINSANICYLFIYTREFLYRDFIYQMQLEQAKSGFSNIEYQLDEFNSILDPEMQGINMDRYKMDSLFETIKEPPKGSEEVFYQIQKLYINYSIVLFLANIPESTLNRQIFTIDDKYEDYKKIREDIEGLKK